MRAGILTFHDEFNYGAFAQAFALQEVLRGYGCETEFINYKSRQAATQQCWSLRSKDPRKLCGNIRKALGFRKDHRLLNLSRRVHTRDDISKLSYDIVFVGSDSVWCYSTPNIGSDSVYFADGINTRRLVSYAPSFGPDAGRDDYPPMLPQWLQAFDSVSVRDRASRDYFQKLTGRPAQLVLDPTLLHSFQIAPESSTGRGYIAAYGAEFSPQAQEEIAAWAREIDLPLISLGYRWRFADKSVIGLSPFEWLAHLRQARFVVTSMFHGTLLAIQFRRPFYCSISDYRRNKLHDILSRLNLLGRCSDSSTSLAAAYHRSLDYDEVEALLSTERTASLAFIEENLKNV